MSPPPNIVADTTKNRLQSLHVIAGRQKHRSCQGADTRGTHQKAEGLGTAMQHLLSENMAGAWTVRHSHKTHHSEQRITRT